MGLIQHKILVVTTCCEEDIKKYRDKALEIYNKDTDYYLASTITDIIISPINGYFSFMILPDGSKEGWEPSEVSDELLTEFIDVLDTDEVYYGLFSYGELGTYCNKCE